MSPARGVLVTLLLALAATSPARAESFDDTAPAALDAQVEAHLLAQRAGQAVSVCESVDISSFDAALREVCGRAALALGDRFATVGQTQLARARWEQALAWDPALADRPDVLERLAGQGAAPLVLPVSKPATPTDGADPQPADVEKDGNAPTETPSDPDTTGGATTEVPTWPALHPSIRDDRHFTTGLGAGYLDGVLGVVVGWQIDPHVALQLSMGLLYQTFDVRMRLLAFPDALTPYIGFGMILPLTPKDRAGLGLTSLEAIYELAEAVHVDVGVNWMVYPGLELSAGVTFVTPFDQVHPDTVVFFPQLTGGASWIF